MTQAFHQFRKHSLLAAAAVGYLLLAGSAPAQDADPPPSSSAPDGQVENEVAPIMEIEPPALPAPQPPAPESSLLELLDQIAAPSASALVVSSEPPAIETIELTRKSRVTTSISGVRRSPIAIQPVIRGYQQQSIYGQYQGANFVPVRFDLDSVLTSIDPGLIDRLVIIPGPYGVKYGPGLAFIDVEATPLPRYDQPQSQWRTNLLYQSSGEQFYGRQTISGGGYRYGYRATYGHKIGSDYESGDGTDIPASYNVRDVDVALALDLSDSSSLQFEYLRQDMTDAEFAGLVFDARMRKMDAFFLRYTYDDSSFFEKWLAEAWYNRTALEGDNLNPGKQRFYQDHLVFNPPGAFAAFTDADATNAGFRIAPTWGDTDDAQLTTGIDLHYVDQALNEFDDFLADLGPLDFDNYPIPRSNMIDVGLFAELTTVLDYRWKVTTGARVDWICTHRDAVYSAVDPVGVEHVFDFGDDVDLNDTLYHGFVSTDYEINPSLNMRFGFGHGQRPPSLTERFAEEPFLTVVQSATSAVLGDSELEPERASQFDLALIGDYENLQFQVAGYWSYIDEHITFAPAFGVPPDPDLKLLDFVNNDATLAGVELAAEYDWTAALAPFVNMRYVSGRNLARDEPLPSIYPLETRAGIRWHEPSEDRYGLDFVARIVGVQDQVATSLTEFSSPGFTTYDLRGYWLVGDRLRITAGFENLFDKNYLEHLNVNLPGVLEPGRNFYVATQMDY